MKRLAEVRNLRAENQPSLPSTLAIERATNPFLRTDQADVIKVAVQQSGQTALKPDQVFATLRRWKDSYKTPVDF